MTESFISIFHVKITKFIKTFKKILYKQFYQQL